MNNHNTSNNPHCLATILPAPAAEKTKIRYRSGKPRLPEGFKHKWVHALRSGDFIQAKGTICGAGQSLDTLGVAFAVAGVPASRMRGLKGPPRAIRNRTIPKMLLDNTEVIEKLSEFNDRGMNFRWMASYIERYL